MTALLINRPEGANWHGNRVDSNMHYVDRRGNVLAEPVSYSNEEGYPDPNTCSLALIPISTAYSNIQSKVQWLTCEMPVTYYS